MSEQALVRARTVHHIRIDSGRPYTQFRTDYETVVPSFDRLEAIGLSKATQGGPPSRAFPTRRRSTVS
jgi:hypothetical protein